MWSHAHSRNIQNGGSVAMNRMISSNEKCTQTSIPWTRFKCRPHTNSRNISLCMVYNTGYIQKMFCQNWVASKSFVRAYFMCLFSEALELLSWNKTQKLYVTLVSWSACVWVPIHIWTSWLTMTTFCKSFTPLTETPTSYFFNFLPPVITIWWMYQL